METVRNLTLRTEGWLPTRWENYLNGNEKESTCPATVIWTSHSLGKLLEWKPLVARVNRNWVSASILPTRWENYLNGNNIGNIARTRANSASHSLGKLLEWKRTKQKL